jgi:hypothetical protein
MADVPEVAVGLADPVAEAAAFAPPAEPEAAAPLAAPGAKAVWLLGNRLLMQLSTHLA